MANAQILVVDDSPDFSRIVCTALKDAGYKVRFVDNADSAFIYLKSELVDLAILDIELPGISGIKLLEMIREEPRTAKLPVIMLTVRAEEAMKVKGLKSGADDYLVKPFSTKELLARVEALIRRSYRSETPNTLDSSGIHVDLNSRSVEAAGKKVSLSPAEFDLLVWLMQRKGNILSHHAIAEALSEGHKDITSENVYVHVSHLRGKLGSQGKSIETVYGVGYKFSD